MRPVILFVWFVVSCSTVCAQGVYPLHSGNRWEYWEPPPPPNYYAWTTRSVGDTIMPNTITYTVLRSDGGIFDQFFRQEGPTVYEYLVSDTAEYVLYDFSKMVGDTVSIRYYPTDTIITTVSRIGFGIIFGRPRMQWEFYEHATRSSFFVVREITDSIGMTYMLHEPGIEFYLRGAIIDSTQYGIITSIEYSHAPRPYNYELPQNYPNPFNSTTTVQFRLPTGEDATISVFDLLGRKIRTLFAGRAFEGRQSILWDGKDDWGVDLASGVYLCRLQTQTFVGSTKMILLR